MGFHLIDPNYQSALDLMTTRPVAAVMERQNRFVQKCRDMGILAAADGLYIFGADAQASKINLANPGNFTLTGGTTTTWAATGATGTGLSAGALSTGFIPNTAGGHWTLNDACMFLWSNTAGASAGSLNYDMGNGTAAVRLLNSSNVFAYSMNDGTVATVANPDPTGFHAIGRRLASGTGAKFARRNLAQITSATTASTAMPSAAIVILGTTGGYSARQLMFAGFGSCLSDDQLNALYWIGREYGFACGALS